MMSAAYKHSKGHQNHSNRPTGFTVRTKIDFYMKNGGHLEKWALSWIFKWLHNSKTWFPHRLKHAKRYQDHSNQLYSVLELKLILHAEWYVANLENIGRHLEFSNHQFGKFDQKHILSMFWQFYDCILICTIVIK